MSLEAIFWDNDGILVDTERLYFRANSDVLETEGIALDAEVFRQHWLLGHRGLVAVGEKMNWDEEKISELRVRRDRRYSELLSRGDLVFPKVPDTLARIPPGILQAIVTSSKREHFDLIHSKSGLLPYFHFVIGEGDYENSKPNPEPYLRALERAALPPQSCLVIEDSERGLIAATSAGIRCWVLPSDLTKGGDFSLAERVLTSIDEILEAI